MGKIANRQSLVFSRCGQVSQTIPQFYVEQMLHERPPIARFELQRNERRVSENQFCSLGGDMGPQRTLVTQIAAITLASDSVMTVAQFRPSKKGRQVRGGGGIAIGLPPPNNKHHERHSEVRSAQTLALQASVLEILQ